jgi:outer membrane lipoprotein-sorting protein
VKRALAGICAVVLTGCPSAAPPPSRFPTAADALARMKATYRCARGARGDAKFDSFSNRGRIRGKLLLFTNRPNRIRLDVLSPPPFNSIVSTLTTDDGRFSFLDLRQRKFFEGLASACNIARLTEVPVETQALVSLLGGQAPLLVHHDSDLQMEWSSDGYYLIRIPSTRGASEELRVAPTPADFQKPWSAQRLRVLDVRVVQQGIELYHASLDNHEWTNTAPPQVDPDGIEPPIPPSGPACTVEVPRRISIEVKESGGDVLFRYEEVKVNPPLPPGVFTQSPPPGAERVRVECGE